MLAAAPELRELGGDRGSFCDIELQVGKENFAVHLEHEDAIAFCKKAEPGCAVQVTGTLKPHVWETKRRYKRSFVSIVSEETSIISPPARTRPEDIE